MNATNNHRKRVTIIAVLGLIAVVFLISLISANCQTCGNTRVTPAPVISSGIKITALSQSIDDNAVNTLFVSVENLDSFSKTIEYKKYSCRCQQHLGDPVIPGCYEFWPFKNSCEYVTETMTLAPYENRTMELSTSQYQNMKCGSFQLDLSLISVNGIPDTKLMAWSFADLCNDCSQVEICDDNSDCDDGIYCNGAEVCNSNHVCESGNSVSCSNLNLPAIASCTNNPDSNPFTFDIANAVFGVCNENSNSCEVGNYSFSHELIVGKCGVECIKNSDCDKNEFCNNDYECEKETTHNEKKKLTFLGSSCSSIWKCSDWSECADGVQTRNCEDNAGCESSLNKPSEVQGCSASLQNILEPAKIEKGFNYLFWILIGIGIILLLIVVALIVKG